MFGRTVDRRLRRPHEIQAKLLQLSQNFRLPGFRSAPTGTSTKNTFLNYFICLHRLRAGVRFGAYPHWSQRGFRLQLLAALVDAGVVTKSTAIDCTHIKIERAAFGVKGGARRKRSGGRVAAGPRRYMRSKIHALTDVVRRPNALMLTPSNVSDIKAAPALLEHAGRMR